MILIQFGNDREFLLAASIVAIFWLSDCVKSSEVVQYESDEVVLIFWRLARNMRGDSLGVLTPLQKISCWKLCPYEGIYSVRCKKHSTFVAIIINVV